MSKDWPRRPTGRPPPKMLPRRERQPFCNQMEIIEDETRSVVRWAVVHSPEPEPKPRCPLLPREPGPLIPIQRRVTNKAPNTLTFLPPLHDTRSATSHSNKRPSPPRALDDSSPAPEIEEELVADPWDSMMCSNWKPRPPPGAPRKTARRRVKRAN